MGNLYSGAEIVFKCLEDQKVEHIFGYPGGAVLHIYDALEAQDDITHVLVRHEQGAAGELMRDCYGIGMPIYALAVAPNAQPATARIYGESR